MGGKKFVIIFVLSLLFVYFINVTSFAHSSNIGIDGADGTTYDECIKYELDMLADAYYEENWYTLVSYYDNNYQMDHLDDDIEIIYYEIIDNGYFDSNITWGENPTKYKQHIQYGIDKWNNITLFKKTEAGTYTKVPLVNLVDINSLSDRNGIEPNIIIAPGYIEIEDVTGQAIPLENSFIEEDYQVVNDIAHKHYSQYLIEIYPENMADVSIEYPYLVYTTCHEIAHALGLQDIDAYEGCGNFFTWHHTNLLMGYGDVNRRDYDITYNDMAGVLLTREHHTAEDHEWLYDPSVGVEQGHKLICSLCNVVKYVNDLSSYEYDIYQSCCTGFTTSEEYMAAHTMDSPYMIPLASYGNKDYYKCSKCKYIQGFYDLPRQAYMYQGTYTEDYHVLHNNVLGLEYDVMFPHDFSVALDDGSYKCKDCPYTTNGSIYVDYIEQELNCVMNAALDTTYLGKNEKLIYKLNATCTGEYLISCFSDQAVEIELFDFEMRKIDCEATYVDEGFNGWFNRIITEEDIIYVRIGFNSPDSEGYINFNTFATNDETGYHETIDLYERLVTYNHAHDEISNFNFYNTEARFVKISLLSSYDIEEIYDGTIKVFDDSRELVNKYSDLVYTKKAVSGYNQTSMIIYLPNVSTYSIRVDNTYLPYNTMLTIELLDEDTYDCFENDTMYIFEDMEARFDNVKVISFTQDVKLSVDLDYYGTTSNGAGIVMVLVDALNNIEVINKDYVSPGNAYISFDVNLSKGSYYFGYLGNNLEGNVSLSITRYTQVDTNMIMTDPDSLSGYGTEVSLNGGSYRGTTITSGFTRLAFLEFNAYSRSRLDYNWYSSDESALTVSAYGTMTAYLVTEATTVTVLAVHKSQYDVVYSITITVLPDVTAPKIVKSIYLTLSRNATYTLQLDSSFISTSISQYDWTSFNNSYATMSAWGTIKTYSTSTTTRITGVYKYNPRYTIYIELTIE